MQLTRPKKVSWSRLWCRCDEGIQGRKRSFLSWVFIKNRTMVFCYCGKEALIQISRTPRNPGRRFYGCPDQAATCGFFVWVEHVKCSRCYDVIPAIMTGKNKLQMELKVAEMKAEHLKINLIMTWVGFFMIVNALMKM